LRFLLTQQQLSCYTVATGKRREHDMTREELIEQRKGMTNEEVIKDVIEKMADRYAEMYSDARDEYRWGKMSGLDADALSDMRAHMHEMVTKEVTLRELIGTLDERCSAYVNGIEY